MYNREKMATNKRARRQIAASVREPNKLRTPVLILLILFVLIGVYTHHVSSTPTVNQQLAAANNIENLISEFLDEAGDRLKKSRLDGMNHVRQTLRFGRSDPLFSRPNDQATLEEFLNSQRYLD